MLQLREYFRYRKELDRHGIKSLETPKQEDVGLILPKLAGDNIEEHFLNIAKQQVEPYQKLISSIVTAEIPEMPKVILSLPLHSVSYNLYTLDLVVHTWMDLL